MILEAVILQVKGGMETEYESVFKQASSIISSMQGYINHELQRCMEQKGKYLLLVQWETLEDHTIGFRQSEQYQEWKSLLHHFYDPFPTVEHFERIELSRNWTWPSINTWKVTSNNDNYKWAVHMDSLLYFCLAYIFVKMLVVCLLGL